MKIISKWGKKLFQSGAASKTFYFKVGQAIFQSGAETVISKWVNAYFKVGQKLFQSGAVTSKWGKMLFHSGAVISKWGNYFKVGHNASLSQRSFKEILILPCYFRFSSSFIVLYHLLTSPHAQRNITSNICIIYSPPDILYTLRFCYIIYFVVSQIYSGKNFLKDGCYFRQVISTVAKESLITSNLTQRTVET